MNRSAALFFLAGCAALIPPGAVFGGEDSPQVPTLPREARWEVLIEPLVVLPEDLPVLVKVESNRAATARRDTLHYSDGRQLERWFIPYSEGRQIMLQEQLQRDRRILLLEVDAESPEQPDADWPELSWIATAGEPQEVDFEGSKALRFEAAGAPPFLLPRQAWLHAENGLPLASEDGLRRFRYRFLGPPVPMSLPEQFAERLREHQRQVAAEQTRSLLLP
jgi:hypothetical protein